MLALEKNGFIISIVLSLLIGATIVYYLNNKIRRVESAISKQSNVLTSFISSVKNDFKTNITEQYNEKILSGPASNDATLEAKNVAGEVYGNGKIAVSDDSESENTTDSENDYESDIDTNSDDEESNKNNDVVKLIELKDNNVISNNEIKSVSLTETINNLNNEDKNDDNLSESSEESDFESDKEVIPVIEDAIDLNKNDNTEIDLNIIVPIDDELKDSKKENESLDVHKLLSKHHTTLNNVADEDSNKYSKMKVDELRKLAIERNLVDDNIDINKLRKKEIVALFDTNDNN